MSDVAALDIAGIDSLMPIEVEHSLDTRDTILYALGVGAGIPEDGSAQVDLRFVYEQRLEALPTMAVVLGYPGFWMRRPEFGIDWRRVLHVDQMVQLHAPLPVAGRIRGVMTLDSVHARGPGRGVLLKVRREITDADTGAPLATVLQGSLLRGNEGPDGSREELPRWPTPPEREPEASLELATRPEQALTYRLLGDDNPLHIDPEVARSAGFEEPILHGLCTFGIAGRAIVRLVCDGEPGRLRSIGGRFTSPVHPGESILTEVWRTGPGAAMYRCSVPGRGVVAIDSGLVELA